MTKSETNQFHGDAFEFVRNGDLNARTFFAPTQGYTEAESVQLVDPVTGVPFLNNQIPTSRLSAPSLFFLQHIPLPNGPNGQLTYTGPTFVEDDDQFMTKIDYLRGKNQLSGRYFWDLENMG